VNIDLDLEIVQSLQHGHGGWTEGMFEVRNRNWFKNSDKRTWHLWLCTNELNVASGVPTIQPLFRQIFVGLLVVCVQGPSLLKKFGGDNPLLFAFQCRHIIFTQPCYDHRIYIF